MESALIDRKAIPQTARGLRTRERLLRAATVVFTQHGYLDAKVTDITVEAKVASGTFYTYFNSKADILAALFERMNDEMYTATALPHTEGQSASARIEDANRAYVRAYRANAGLLGILEQVATFNPAFRELRRLTRQTFRSRVENGLVRLQASGAIDPDLQARCAAEALTSMVSNFCYVSLVLGEAYDENDAVHTLTTLWTRGIGLRDETALSVSDSASADGSMDGQAHVASILPQVAT